MSYLNSELANAFAQNQIALALVRNSYQNGFVNFLDLLNVEPTTLVAEDALAQSDLTVITDLVAVFKALGGGWQTE